MEWPHTWHEFVNNPIYVIAAAIAIWQLVKQVLIPWWLRYQERRFDHTAQRQISADELREREQQHANELETLKQQQQDDRHREYFAAMNRQSEAVFAVQSATADLTAAVGRLGTIVDGMQVVQVEHTTVLRNVQRDQNRTTRAFEALVERMFVEMDVHMPENGDDTAELVHDG